MTNCGKEAEPGYPAEHVLGDIRAPWSVADVLRQFFFPPVWILEAGLNNDLRHVTKL